MYAKFLKRVLDFLLSLCALLVLLPVMLILISVGAVAMKGNPFFTQQRPGRGERIFRLIKFRTMTNEKDQNGELLPDEKRLNGYGKFLRSTSLDELPELINILKGDMSIVGPRPLLVKYLPYYTEVEQKRHTVRPGLTGLAQVSGRNYLNWNDRLAKDVEYVNHITFGGDLKILYMTVAQIIKKQDIAVDSYLVEPDLDEERKDMQGIVHE